MKIYVKSATDISAIQAKIARKEEDIRKKKQLIDKRNATIDKQLIAVILGCDAACFHRCESLDALFEVRLEVFDALVSHLDRVFEGVHGTVNLGLAPPEYSLKKSHSICILFLLILSGQI